ncbi:19204_t:CDS:2 [Funneliformis geosporum]|uniref:14664_t:CDS:1 n=1 Tax=Funneliformis geosporum TaxID=1117311 RepID=A0A9W4SIY4_9GLOM|nr:14664_t:CDS:2 [Funneliformis geosporum]CAI2172228.1 19204_t:CDS:2 [Funneliformis geosporum]
MSTNSKSPENSLFDIPPKSPLQEKEKRDDNVDCNSLNEIILTPITPSNNFLSLHKICNIIQHSSPTESQKSINGPISREEDKTKSNPLGSAHHFNAQTSIPTASTEDNMCHKLINDNEDNNGSEKKFSVVNDNIHIKKEEREKNSSYLLNSQDDKKEIYNHTLSSKITRVKLLEPMATAETRCTNPLCLQCQNARPNLSPIQSTSNYPSTSINPIQYYLALPNNDFYPQAPWILPSSVYTPSQPQTPHQHEQNPRSTEEKTIYNQTNVQSKRRRRRNIKAMIYSVNESTTRSGELYRCSNCGVRETPAWRRDLQGDALLCNAFSRLKDVLDLLKLVRTERFVWRDLVELVLDKNVRIVEQPKLHVGEDL